MAHDVLMLWMDCESTGLLTDPRMPTTLEWSWTVTDPPGEQLSLLRQVFTAIPTSGATVVPGAVNCDSEGNPGVVRWPGDDYPIQLVRDMHDKSGLTEEWVTTYLKRPHRVLYPGAELDRLLLDTIYEDGLADRNTRIYLAGAGVAHMEHRILPLICPRVADLLHYHVVDVSGFLRVRKLRFGGGPGTVDEHLAQVGPPSGGDRWSSIEVSSSRYDAMMFTADGRRSTLGAEWAALEASPHRAAPDVARSLMAYRTLPRG